MADGAIDPNFNGTGYAVGPLFSGQDNRVPMVIESDGKIVVGGSSGGSMTLLRYNLDGSLDTTFGSGGAAQRQFAGTPTGSVGTSGATAMTLDTNGDILVAGYGGSQSMFVARYTAGGTYRASAVCFAPHLIDYSARALAIRPNGNIVLVGYAHDRHAAVLDPTQPVVTYGQRAVVPLAANAVGNSTTACGLYTEVNNLSRGSAGVTIDGLGHDGTVLDATLAGRQYDAVSATGNNGYTVASTIGPDGAGWLARYTAAGALDPAFNGGARLPISGVSFHALKALADGSVLAAGDTPNGALASDRQMVVAKVAGNGTMAAFGSGGIARITVGSGDNTAQALAVQADNRVIVGGAAIVGGRAGLGLARFTATGDIDGNSAWSGGQTTTAIPDGAAYVTGMALNGNVLGVSGRASITGGIAPVAARYYAIGDPPPVPVPPAPPVVVPTSPGGGTTGSGTTTGGGTTTSRGGTTTGGGVTQATAKKKNVVKQCIVPKVTGKAVNKARSTVLSKGCKVAVVYKKSHKKKGTVLSINRKAGKKLVYRALVKMTIAKPF